MVVVLNIEDTGAVPAADGNQPAPINGGIGVDGFLTGYGNYFGVRTTVEGDGTASFQGTVQGTFCTTSWCAITHYTGC
jgi:hypothetical protein